MQRSWFVVAAAILVLTSSCTTGLRPKPIKGLTPATTHLRIKPERGPAQRVALEEYVRATVLSEFDPSSGDQADVTRMLQVQSVIARTYAIAHRSRHASEGFDLCATTHCQLYQPARLKGSMWTAAVNAAAKDTEGMVLWYENAPARALFHSDCGGHTSAVHDVWQGPSRPYLLAKKDDGPADAAHTPWRFEVEADALGKVLNADPRTRIGRQLTGIRVSRRDSGGRATEVALDGPRRAAVRGEDLRSVMTRAFGVKSIRSTKFEVRKTGRTFVFVGRGFGHGVGLCQTGAYARLKAGARPEHVLARYYPGTRLVVLR